MRITVGIPTHDSHPAHFTYDAMQLGIFSIAALPEDTVFGVNMVSGTYIHDARNQLLQAALDQGADYVLWIDADMRFPRDALVRLLKHKVAMVGINYAKRGVPSGFVAIKKVGLGSQGVKLRTDDESTGLEEVEAVGFGLVLMKTTALRGMPDPNETPWFQNVHLGGGQFLGEDVHFCERFREIGNKIFVDHDLSKQCRHIGSFEYELAHAASEVAA